MRYTRRTREIKQQTWRSREALEQQQQKQQRQTGDSFIGLRAIIIGPSGALVLAIQLRVCMFVFV